MARLGMATRSLGRMRGVANMAPGGGILCSMFVTAILCDLTDSRFFRAAIWCAMASLFSLFGLMHGNNQVFADGTEMHAHTGSGCGTGTGNATLDAELGVSVGPCAHTGGDPYTTDLGEVMVSTATMPSISPTCGHSVTRCPRGPTPRCDRAAAASPRRSRPRPSTPRPAAPAAPPARTGRACLRGRACKGVALGALAD